MNKVIVGLIVTVALSIIVISLWRINMTDNSGEYVPLEKTAPDIRNISYTIDGITFDLKDGWGEKVYTPGSASKNSLAINGEPVFGDLDNDGDIDAAVLLVNNPGGSGTFYYAALAINDETGYQSTNAILLGDRISSQSVEIIDGRALFKYAVRKAGEPMSAEPSIAKTIWIHYNKRTAAIGELVKDFEGEADPNRMTLGMKSWNWLHTKYNNDTEVIPGDPTEFTITFNPDSTFSATTDCNSIRGKYVLDDGRISFGDFIATRMFCENSLENEFTKMLGNVNSFFFTSRGDLVFELKYDSGSMIFK